MGWIDLAQDRGMWQALLNAVMNVKVSFSRTWLHDLSVCTIFEKAVTGMIAPNPCLFPYFLWEYYSWFTPAMSGT